MKLIRQSLKKQKKTVKYNDDLECLRQEHLEVYGYLARYGPPINSSNSVTIYYQRQMLRYFCYELNKVPSELIEYYECGRDFSRICDCNFYIFTKYIRLRFDEKYTESLITIFRLLNTGEESNIIIAVQLARKELPLDGV